MDENKRHTLHVINYQIFKCCGLCKHSKIKPGQMFGDCLKFDYKHLKHSEPSKYLSINMFGGCSSWVGEEKKMPQLHQFIHFIK